MDSNVKTENHQLSATYPLKNCGRSVGLCSEGDYINGTMESDFYSGNPAPADRKSEWKAATNWALYADYIVEVQR